MFSFCFNGILRRRTTMILALCLLGTACSKTSEPNEADLKAALAARVGTGANGLTFVSFENVKCSPFEGAFVCDVKSQTRNNPMGSSWDKPMTITMRASTPPAPSPDPVVFKNVRKPPFSREDFELRGADAPFSTNYAPLSGYYGWFNRRNAALCSSLTKGLHIARES